jgi:hypothetical protein
MSPHQDLAEKLKLAIAAWGSLWANGTVERGYSVEHYLGGWDTDDSKVVVIATASDSERADRSGSDQTTVTINVAYLSRITAATNAVCDTHDDRVESLRQFIRRQTRVTLTSGRDAHRAKVSLSTPYDAKMIRSKEIYAASIACEFSFGEEVA